MTACAGYVHIASAFVLPIASTLNQVALYSSGSASVPCRLSLDKDIGMYVC